MAMETSAKPLQETPNWAKRRQPKISPENERSFAIKSKYNLNNNFASERLRAEKAKTEIILLQREQMIELHNIKMENEKLKKKLFEKLLNRVKGKYVYLYNL